MVATPSAALFSSGVRLLRDHSISVEAERFSGAKTLNKTVLSRLLSNTPLSSKSAARSVAPLFAVVPLTTYVLHSYCNATAVKLSTGKLVYV